MEQEAIRWHILHDQNSSSIHIGHVGHVPSHHGTIASIFEQLLQRLGFCARLPPRGRPTTSIDTFIEEAAFVRRLNPDFPIAKRLYVSCDDNLDKMREWFGAFYHRPEMADKVAVWGSPQKIVEAVEKLRAAGTSHVLLHPVVDEEAQLERLASEVIAKF